MWEYAKRRRSVDAEFSDDLVVALMTAGYVPGAIQPVSGGTTPEKRTGLPCPDCGFIQQRLDIHRSDDTIFVRVSTAIAASAAAKEIKGIVTLLKMFLPERP